MIQMIIREAEIEDIEQILIVRNSVNENTLSDPSKVSVEECADFLFHRGKGWVCEIDRLVVGFSIVDMKENNIWALFMDPHYEKKGIGRKLHDVMLDWYFNQTQTTVWLSTTSETRAETFYRKAGWKEVCMLAADEIKFEMTYDYWQKQKIKNI